MAAVVVSMICWMSLWRCGSVGGGVVCLRGVVAGRGAAIGVIRTGRRRRISRRHGLLLQRNMGRLRTIEVGSWLGECLGVVGSVRGCGRWLFLLVLVRVPR